MGQITYKINSGYPNFTAHIEPNVAADQVHSSTGTYSFTDIPVGDYSITITDGIGCEAFIDNIHISYRVTLLKKIDSCFHHFNSSDIIHRDTPLIFNMERTMGIEPT